MEENNNEKVNENMEHDDREQGKEENKGKEVKKLYRAIEGRMFCGVCAGLANYFNIDPTIVRLITVLTAFTGYGIFAYVIGAIIIPDYS